MGLKTSPKLEERIEALLQSEELTDDNKSVPYVFIVPLSHLFSGTIVLGVMVCSWPFDIPNFAVCLLFVFFLSNLTLPLG
jgi:hypothetical protein